jgi:hypothetical protein
VLILGIRRDLGRLPGGEPPPELAALARRWGRAGYDSDVRLVTADSFWNSLEPSTPVAAFEATESFLLARP